MKEEEKKQSTPLYLNQQTAARDLGITRSIEPEAHPTVITPITPDVKALNVTTKETS